VEDKGMPTLMEQLKRHDWYYAYSDDHRVFTAGSSESRRLSQKVESLNCPYSMAQLRMAVHNMVVEEFAEEQPGEWYRQPRKYKNMAASRREELIHRADQVQILAWIEYQG
jgi:hypothetical protein